MRTFTVAIDGPVAAGKTTIGRHLARRISALFFDTGILYRAVAHTVLNRNVDPEHDDAVADVAASLRAELAEIAGETRLLVEGRDVTSELRTPEIDRALPPISANPDVREHLLDTQRKMVKDRRAVVVGRDIGTVILPDANLKLFLDADPDVRATRRYDELRERGVDIDWQTVHRDLLARDERDTGRDLAPLLVADDAVVIDASEKDIDELVDLIVGLVEERDGMPCK